jgi:hypothetical protein
MDNLKEAASYASTVISEQSWQVNTITSQMNEGYKSGQ